jgi:hypothetical protein
MANFVPQKLMRPVEEFPDVPTIFAEGIYNLANTSNVAKFYLVRNDASLVAADQAQITPVAQIIFPLDGLRNSFAFLEDAINKLMAQNVISIQSLDAARAGLRHVNYGYSVRGDWLSRPFPKRNDR